MTLLLYAPAKPESEVMTMYPVFLTVRALNIGWETSSIFSAILVTTSSIFLLYGVNPLAFDSALFILEAETSSIAVVICFVLPVESIRAFIRSEERRVWHEYWYL